MVQKGKALPWLNYTRRGEICKVQGVAIHKAIAKLVKSAETNNT